MRIKCLQNVISMDELSKFYQKKHFSVILDTDFSHKSEAFCKQKPTFADISVAMATWSDAARDRHTPTGFAMTSINKS